MKFISTKSFMPFVWYRIALGILLFVPGRGRCAEPARGRIRRLNHRRTA